MRAQACQPRPSGALDETSARETGISVQSHAVETTWVWGLPLARLTLAETVDRVCGLIEACRPAYFITAPTHYAMLTERYADLREINSRAAFIVADGTPLVWASRHSGRPLKERVAGSDLIFELCAEAARKGYRLFLLGGAEGVAEEAGRRLCERYPGLQIVGAECPPFRELAEEEERALIVRVRSAQPDLLITAFTMPRGERWLAAHYADLGVKVAINLGAALDFAAGRIRRAPRWMQRSGLEWAFRLGLEPRRLSGRYARNAWFIIRMVIRELRSGPAAHYHQIIPNATTDP